jgi:hypothetical protein
MITLRRMCAFFKKRWDSVSSGCLPGKSNTRFYDVKSNRAPPLSADNSLEQQLEHFQELLSYFTSFLTSDLRIEAIKHQIGRISEKLNQIDKGISRLHGVQRDRLLNQVKKPLDNYLCLLCDSVFFNCSLNKDNLQKFMRDLEFIEHHILQYYNKIGAISMFELKQRVSYFKIYLHQEYCMYNQRKQYQEMRSSGDIWLEHQRQLIRCPRLRNSWPLSFSSFNANTNSL